MNARGLTVAATITALLLLPGCGGDTTVTTPDGSVKVESDGSGMKIEGEDGITIETGTELPDGFPDDVPLVEGRIIQALEVAGPDGGFSVNIEADGSLDDAFDEARSLLTDAGFTEEGSQVTTGAMSTGVFRSASWQVLVGVTPSGDGDGVLLSYTVAPPSD